MLISKEMKSILIVEDEILHQKLYASYINGEYIIHFATSVDEALTQLKDQEINLIILDLQLRKSDGLDLVRDLRGNGNNIPIIAITAHAFDTDRKNCIEAGCNDFYSKPITKRAVLDAIQQYTA